MRLSQNATMYTASAEAWLRISAAHSIAWNEIVNDATVRHGDGSGTLISGVYRDHYPKDVKALLRYHARAQGEAIDTAYALWRKSRRSRDLFRARRREFAS